MSLFIWGKFSSSATVILQRTQNVGMWFYRPFGESQFTVSHTSHSLSFSFSQTHLMHTSTLIYPDSLISLVFWPESYMGFAMKYYFEWFQLSLSSSVLVPFLCYFRSWPPVICFFILLLDITFTHFQTRIGYLAIVLAPFSDINYNNCWIQICLWQVCGAKRLLCKLLHEVIISIAKAVIVWGAYFWSLHIFQNSYFNKTVRAYYRLKQVSVSIWIYK